MHKLLIASLLIFTSSIALGRSKGASYWQDYGPASMVAFPSAEYIPLLVIEDTIKLIIAYDDPLAASVLNEFFKTFLKPKLKLSIDKYQLNEFKPITQPIGLEQAKDANLEHIRQMQYHAKQPEQLMYAINSEFLNLTPEPSIHQLLTIAYHSQYYHYVSSGIAISPNFYEQYLKLPNNNLRAYTMSYALEKAYGTTSEHWQLSVTNHLLTKLTQLQTAVAAKI